MGWRKDGDSPISPVGQIRINEYVQENIGAFGDRTLRQIRILERGAWILGAKMRMAGSSTSVTEPACLPVIPLAVTYSGKVSELISNPPLLPISQVSAPCARQADLQHALHVAALPVMYLKGWDDSITPSLSANTAILKPTDGEVGYTVRQQRL